MKRILIKWGLPVVLLLVAVYFAAGLILPFCHLRTVGEEYRLLVQGRRIFLRIFGWVMQPFRYFL